MPTEFKRPIYTPRQRRQRYAVLALVVIGLAGAAYFGPTLRKHQPNYYDPARTALQIGASFVVSPAVAQAAVAIKTIAAVILFNINILPCWSNDRHSVLDQ